MDRGILRSVLDLLAGAVSDGRAIRGGQCSAPTKALDVSTELNVEVKAWRDIWSAGEGVGSIHDLPSVGGRVRRLAAEYDGARV